MDAININPTTARKNLYSLLKQVNTNHIPITISSNKGENSDAILIGKKDWEAIQETLYLESHGVGDIVRKREADDTGFTNVDDIDWDNL